MHQRNPSRLVPATQPDMKLESIVAKCLTMADVIRALEMPVNSSSYRTVRRRIERAGVSIDHFKRNRPMPPVPKNVSPFRIRSKTEGRETTSRLRAAMLSAGIAMKCSECALPGVWLGRELTLDIDHINGNALDCRLGNLRFLCPNCHRQTATYGRSKLPPRKVLGFLTPQRVREMRAAWGPYQKNQRGLVPARELAARFGVSQSTVFHVVSRRKWAHVE